MDNHITIIDPFSDRSQDGQETAKLVEHILPKQIKARQADFEKRAARVRRAAERQGLGYIILVKDDKLDLGAVMAKAQRDDALFLIGHLVVSFHLDPQALAKVLQDTPREG